MRGYEIVFEYQGVKYEASVCFELHACYDPEGRVFFAPWGPTLDFWAGPLNSNDVTHSFPKLASEHPGAVVAPDEMAAEVWEAAVLAFYFEEAVA